jgi:Fic family protein
MEMGPKFFSSLSNGHLVPIMRGLKAYVPDPLPPGLDRIALFDCVAQASAALGELNGLGSDLANPYLLIGPMQRQEAISSSRMEGTYSTMAGLAYLEAGSKPHAADRDTREVMNYVRALRNAIERLPTLPVCLRLLKDIHADLFADPLNARAAMVNPGAFKRDQNYIGRGPIETARFVPPPPSESLQCLDALERHIQRPSRKGIPDIVDAALIHYQFEAIHPFADGNGRVGRILIPLILVERGALSQPYLYISPFLESRRDQYLDLLFEVTAAGAWTPWIEFFCEAVVESSARAIATIKGLKALRADYRARMERVSQSRHMFDTIDWLFERPAITTPDLAKKAGVTFRAAKQQIGKFIEAGILRESPGSERPQIFHAHEILGLAGN